MSKKKVLFISSVGGHLTQLLQLKPLFKEYNSYLITERDKVTLKLTHLEKDAKISLIHPVRKSNIFLLNFNRIILLIESFIKFLIIMPDIVVSTGSVTGAVMLKIANLFKRKTIYIETFASVKKPTRTGLLVYPFVDRFYVQWESMLEFFPNAIYLGKLY